MVDTDELRRLIAEAPTSASSIEPVGWKAFHDLRFAAVKALPGLLDIADSRLADRTKAAHAINEAQILRRELKTRKAQVSELILDHIRSEGTWIEWTRDIKAERDSLKAEVERLKNICEMLNE